MTDHIMTPSEKLRSIASSIWIVCIANAIREVAEEIEHIDTIHQDMRLVPVWLLERVERSLGSFTSDEGWAQTDMDTMDSVSALLATTAHAPAQDVGLTDEERQQVFKAAESRMEREINLSWRNAVVDEVIAAIRAKETSHA